MHSTLYNYLVKDGTLIYYIKYSLAHEQSLNTPLTKAFPWLTTQEGSIYWSTLNYILSSKNISTSLNSYDIEYLKTHHPEYFI